MTAEDRLSAFLSEGQGPARDLAFEVEVMKRVAGRELLRAVGVSGLFAGAGGIVLWALAPMLTPVIEPAAAFAAPAAAILAATAGLVLFGQGMMQRA